MKKRPRNRPLCLFFYIIILSVIQGCTATKFVPAGESFYEGAEIKFMPQGNIRRQGAIAENLQEIITPKPNKKFLGMRPGVWFYYKAGEPKKPKGFKYFMKTKLGRPPVLLSDIKPVRTAEMLQAELQNEGYFKSTVQSEVVTKGKESTVIYTAILYPPFRLRNIEQHLFDSLQYPKIVQAMDKNTMIRKNQRYRLQRLKAEQERLEEVLENQGFYFFDDRYLLFDADSTVGKRRIDLDLHFEPGMPDKAVRTYRVKTINIFPNYELTNDSMATTADTVNVNGYTYIDNQHNFRPYILTDVINLHPDSVYRRIDEEYTLSHLMGLKAFKFVNIKFREQDSSSLHADIYLTPLLKKSVRAQLQAISKSNNFVGPGFELTFTNRNLFRGAELFQLRLNSAYEVQISRQQSGALNAIEFGAESSMSIPRFITPFGIFRYRSAKYLPQTNFKLSYNLQQRLQYFRLTSLNGGYGFLWRETTLKTHELYPVDVSFVKLGKTSDAFNDLLKDSPALENSFQNQFILGSHYTFTLNTQMKEDIEMKYDPKARRKSDFYFSGTIDLSGNLLSAGQNLAKVNEGEKQFFGLPYSQYVRGDIDFRYYYKINKHSKLATRVIAGLGHAYGNSSTMPYIKQFASGGSNSVRAFPARSLGPGSYNVRLDTTIKSRTFFVDQRGDIKLEGSVEYRFDIIRSFKGALFADAGNIWLRDVDPKRPGSEFDRDTFISQLAVGTGAGIRFDLNFFVLRLDLAFPLRKPFLPAGDRWTFDDIDFGSKDWRRQNLILNIAIGYPF
ncbi:MAG TPA: BamA/TamA family outer membrane protein [Cyclobacteriaceae bacterium]|nr:BamA/TamA family outer membrane protein [Cyclobacteriaceae bacterium]